MATKTNYTTGKICRAAFKRVWEKLKTDDTAVTAAKGPFVASKDGVNGNNSGDVCGEELVEDDKDVTVVSDKEETPKKKAPKKPSTPKKAAAPKRKVGASTTPVKATNGEAKVKTPRKTAAMKKKEAEAAKLKAEEEAENGDGAGDAENGDTMETDIKKDEVENDVDEKEGARIQNSDDEMIPTDHTEEEI